MGKPSLKVKPLSRDPLKYGQATGKEWTKQERNLKPKYHPFEKAKEYTRALNSMKWERLFAKPFIAAFDDHVDTVQCLAKHPTTLSTVAAGDCAGAIRLWDIPTRSASMFIPNAHKGIATGVQFTPDGAALLSCSKDQTVKMWKTHTTAPSDRIKPIAEFLGEHNFDSISYHEQKQEFCTAGQDLEFWDINRTRPIHSFNWGDETINVCIYNRASPHLVLCCMRDRAICLYDSRTHQAANKLYLTNRTNCVSWNPMRPMEFAAANEDSNIYLFDSRRMDRSRGVLHGHVETVLSVDFSPTGRELVSGGFDKTLRIWELTAWDTGKSRDVYVAKRMQRVWTTVWTADNNFILSGSDDCNVRLWKAQASKPMKKMKWKETRALEYGDKLKDRYKAFPEIAKIAKQRPIPKSVKKLQRLRAVVGESVRRKEGNMKRQGQEVKTKNLKKDAVLATME